MPIALDGRRRRSVIAVVLCAVGEPRPLTPAQVLSDGGPVAGEIGDEAIPGTVIPQHLLRVPDGRPDDSPFRFALGAHEDADYWGELDRGDCHRTVPAGLGVACQEHEQSKRLAGPFVSGQSLVEPFLMVLAWLRGVRGRLVFLGGRLVELVGG